MDLEIGSAQDDELTTLMLRGELDVATKPLLDGAFAELLEQGRDQVVVDLTDLTFLDSTGIGALVGHAVGARERGGSVRVRNASGMPLRALQVTGVLPVLGHPEVDSP